MIKQGLHMKIRSKLFYCYLFFIIVYSAFTLLPSPSHITLAKYHISAMSLRLIDVTIILLLAGIWFAGFYGYAKLRDYNQLIQGGKDGKAIAWITKGIFVLVLWLPVPNVISTILTYIGLRHHAFLPVATIIDNYISLLFPLVAFILIGKGARGLIDLVRVRPSFRSINLLAIILVYVGLIDYHLIASTRNRAAVYHLSIWLILSTLAAPYIYMWFVGLLATYEIYRYSRKVRGIVYRNCWALLALGIGWLIVTSIGLQYLTTVSNRLGSLSIYWVLAIIYSLLLVLSVGFVIIAIGTRKLRKIEEV
jgi:hypothetical protein